MAVRSRRFFAFAGVGTATNAYMLTIPPLRTAIVKSVVYRNRSAGSRDVILKAGGSGVPLFADSLGAGVLRTTDTYVVFHPGEQLWLDVGSNVDVSVHGVLLLGAPEE